MVCTIKCVYKKMLSRYVQPKGTRCVDNGIEKKYQNRRLIAHAQGISRTLTARPGGVNQPQKGDLTPAGKTIKVKRGARPPPFIPQRTGEQRKEKAHDMKRGLFAKRHGWFLHQLLGTTWGP
jgi:hypothetical protein